jgi:two-component system OmpR family sensor kinase
VLVLPLAGGGAVVVAAPLGDVQNTVQRLAALQLVIGVVVLLAFAALGYAVVRRSLRPLVEVESTAEAIAAGDLTRRVPESDPRTEVGSLAGSLNAMLGQIEGAFGAQRASEANARQSEERMRRFIADASHELRTPLTSIRGFAELYRQGAVSDPAELDRVMRRVEDEAARMGLLVEDLLLLARLDQQRPLQREPVDLLDLARDAVHDASAVDPGRPVSLEVMSGEPPVVTGDDARLRQVFGNLVTNALTHTPAGTPVVVRVGTYGAEAVVEVVDRGPGLSAEQAARAFERFYRADASRTRAHGGSGLGLSIVAALVAAHGGRVDLDTAPGEGATFRVRLPLEAPVRAG